MSETESPPPSVRTQFKRSKLCRVIHVDGAWGAVTAQLNVHAALYSEHRAFPDGTVISANPDGTISETPTEDSGIVIREIEADLILSEAAAISLRRWLDDRIEEIARFRREAAAMQLNNPEQK